jgi:signal transduction histidine kinase
MCTEENRKKLVELFRTDQTPNSLQLFLYNTLQINHILITWKIREKIRYTQLLSDGKFTTITLIDNDLQIIINTLKLDVKQYHQLIINDYSLFYSSNQPIILDDTYLFVLEAYIHSIVLKDVSNEFKTRQELLLNNMTNTVKIPLSKILYSAKDQAIDIKQSTLALATSIFDIIDLAKLELGVLKVSSDLVNTRDLCTEVISISQSILKSPHVQIDSYIDPGVPEYISTDAKRVKQILIGLLENSIQHTQVGEITMSVHAILCNTSEEDKSHTINSAIQHHITFTIHDTGAGMSEDIKKTLFASDKLSGGISLRISYLVAKELGGNLTLVSSEIGYGSTFQLQLLS